MRTNICPWSWSWSEDSPPFRFFFLGTLHAFKSIEEERGGNKNSKRWGWGGLKKEPPESKFSAVYHLFTFKNRDTKILEMEHGKEHS